MTVSFWEERWKSPSVTEMTTSPLACALRRCRFSSESLTLRLATASLISLLPSIWRVSSRYTTRVSMCGPTPLPASPSCSKESGCAPWSTWNVIPMLQCSGCSSSVASCICFWACAHTCSNPSTKWGIMCVSSSTTWASASTALRPGWHKSTSALSPGFITSWRVFMYPCTGCCPSSFVSVVVIPNTVTNDRTPSPGRSGRCHLSLQGTSSPYYPSSPVFSSKVYPYFMILGCFIRLSRWLVFSPGPSSLLLLSLRSSLRETLTSSAMDISSSTYSWRWHHTWKWRRSIGTTLTGGVFIQVFLHLRRGLSTVILFYS